MKITMIAAAGLLATGTMTMTAAPAEAQRWGPGYGGPGWHGDRGWQGDRGWRGDRRGWRGDRWDRGGPRWRGGHRWDRGPRWNRGARWNGGGYGRVVCRTGYYGRECFRTFR